MKIHEKVIAESALENLPRETLIKLVEVLYRNYMGVDGRWFQAVENEYGTDVATRFDEDVWAKHSVTEARRLKKALNITEGGLAGVLKALNFGMFQLLHFAPMEIEETDSQKVTVTYTQCPVQALRIEQGRGEFPCKNVGLYGFQNAAAVIDPTVKVKCLVCPPDPHPQDVWCKWEFSI